MPGDPVLTRPERAELASRTSELLKTAAEALEKGNDPFGRSFLSEHEVTFDECMDLAS